jgi:hypothetical protein
MLKSYAIQFTGEDANIYKIEKIAKINYKAFKIHRTKDRYGSLNCFFSLKGLNKSYFFILFTNIFNSLFNSFFCKLFHKTYHNVSPLLYYTKFLLMSIIRT